MIDPLSLGLAYRGVGAVAGLLLGSSAAAAESRVGGAALDVAASAARRVFRSLAQDSSSNKEKLMLEARRAYLLAAGDAVEAYLAAVGVELPSGLAGKIKKPSIPPGVEEAQAIIDLRAKLAEAASELDRGTWLFWRRGSRSSAGTDAILSGGSDAELLAEEDYAGREYGAVRDRLTRILLDELCELEPAIGGIARFERHLTEGYELEPGNPATALHWVELMRQRFGTAIRSTPELRDYMEMRLLVQTQLTVDSVVEQLAVSEQQLVDIKSAVDRVDRNIALLRAEVRPANQLDNLSRREVAASVERCVRGCKPISFVGREAALAGLESFVRASESGVLVVSGEQGAGKSALLREWMTKREATDRVLAYHFYCREARSFLSIRHGLEHLHDQLFRNGAEPGGAMGQEELAQAIGTRIERWSETDRLVLILDGLDHLANGTNASEVHREFRELVFPDWPDASMRGGTFAVITARPKTAEVWSDFRRLPLELGPLAPEDIREFVRRFPQPAISALADHDEAMKALKERTAANPGVLAQVLKQLARDALEGREPLEALGGFAPLAAAVPPPEVQNPFGQFVASQWEELATDPFASELIALLLAAGDPLPAADVEAVLDLELSSQDAWAGERLQELLRRDEEGSLFVSPASAEQLSAILAERSSALGRQLTDHCLRWSEHESVYALRHLPERLKAEGRNEDVFELAGDERYRDLQRERLRLQPEQPLNTARLALEAAIAADDGAAMAKFVLTHIERYQELAADHPLRLWREGGRDEARRRAGLLFSPAQETLWLLLLAAEARADGDEAAARALLDELGARTELPTLDGGMREPAAHLLDSLFDLDRELAENLGCRLLDELGLLSLIGRLGSRAGGDGSGPAAATLEAARRMLGAVESSEGRFQGLLRLSVAMHAAGIQEEAREAINQAQADVLGYTEEPERTEMIRQLAFAQAEHGDVEAALESIWAVQDPAARARLVLDLWTKLSEEQGAAAIERLTADARDIGDEVTRSSLLLICAIAQWRAGQPEAARRLADEAMDATADRIVSVGAELLVLMRWLADPRYAARLDEQVSTLHQRFFEVRATLLSLAVLRSEMAEERDLSADTDADGFHAWRNLLDFALSYISELMGVRALDRRLGQGLRPPDHLFQAGDRLQALLDGGMPPGTEADGSQPPAIERLRAAAQGIERIDHQRLRGALLGMTGCLAGLIGADTLAAELIDALEALDDEAQGLRMLGFLAVTLTWKEGPETVHLSQRLRGRLEDLEPAAGRGLLAAMLATEAGMRGLIEHANALVDEALPVLEAISDRDLRDDALFLTAVAMIMIGRQDEAEAAAADVARASMRLNAFALLAQARASEDPGSAAERLAQIQEEGGRAAADETWSEAWATVFEAFDARGDDEEAEKARAGLIVTLETVRRRRGVALAELSRGLTSLGWLPAGVQVARAGPDAFEQLMALRDVAQRFLFHGDRDSALGLLRELPPDMRASVLVNYTAAEQTHPEDARSLAAALLGPGARARPLGAQATRHAQAGDIEEAMRTAREIRDDAWTGVCVLLEAVERVGDLAGRRASRDAIAQVLSGSWRVDPHPSPGTLGSLADAAAQNGFAAEAGAAAEAIPEPTSRAAVAADLRELAALGVERGANEAASDEPARAGGSTETEAAEAEGEDQLDVARRFGHQWRKLFSFVATRYLLARPPRLDDFKRDLLPELAYEWETAYDACEVLARFYPQASGEIARLVTARARAAD